MDTWLGMLATMAAMTLCALVGNELAKRDPEFREYFDNRKRGKMARERELNACATERCRNSARWMSISEANVLGNDAPQRCPECCDHIAAFTAYLMESRGYSNAQIRQAVSEGRFNEVDWTQIIPPGDTDMPYAYAYVTESLFGR